MPCYDLACFENVPSRPGEERVLRGAVVGKAVVGPQKLVQLFAQLFLTRRGSVPLDPSRGTKFMAAAMAGRIRNPGTLQAEFTLAVSDIMAYLGDGRDNLPADEQLAGATLTRYTIGRDSLALWVTVTSRAGTSAELSLPVDRIVA